ncbi:hypothetical protein NDA11_005765 [Ustilago hordei]|nr:hypothetical protein NDA11_005765 [Ustilago hordei]
MPNSVRSHPMPASEGSRSYDKPAVSSAPPAPFLFAKPSHPAQHSQVPCPSSSTFPTSRLGPEVKGHDSVQVSRPSLSASSSSSSSSDKSSRISSGSSSCDNISTPLTSSVPSTGSSPDQKPTQANSNDKVTPVGSRGRPSAATKAKTKMDPDDFALLPDSVSANAASGSKSNRILGPDGQIYTHGEAARLGFTIRTACEACRNRKLKCSGTLSENGGCARCNSDGIQCIYSARAPIGRPKKRKAEKEEDTTATPAPASSSPKAKGMSKTKSKCKDGSGHARSNSSVRVKTEGGAFVDSSRSSSSSAVQSSYYPGQAHVPASPVRSDAPRHTPQDGYHTPFNIPHSCGYLEGTLNTPSVPSTKLAATSTVWTQNHMPFVMTPSDTVTPHSVIPPSSASTSNTDGQTLRSIEQPTNSSAAKLPSLDDLSVAAFLQSLDTLEISPAELFQQQQQQQQQLLFSSGSSSSNTPANANFGGLGAPFQSSGMASNGIGFTASSVEEWATSSAILQPGLSFAVPADFSWWDLGINGADFGSGAPSVSATPSTELTSMAFSTMRPAQQQMSQSLSHSTNLGSHMASHSSSPAGKGQPRRPKFSADQMWPRGADAGMGQGQIQHTVAASETGLGWSTLPGPSQFSDTLSSPVESHSQQSEEQKNCCSSKATKPEPLSPPAKAPCCSSKPNPKASSEEKAEPASCCARKIAPSAPKSEVKSCCSGHSDGTAPKPDMTTENQIEMGPLSTSAAVTGSTNYTLDCERRRHAALHSHHPGKVHCVPNPSGKGCTCLCDMSVALLSVKQVLRETDPHKQSSSSTSAPEGKKNSFATDTIQLTLTASQAITAQCACSADCPTCQSDPSTEISASLLVSTALQIYARAVRILREGFAATAASGKETVGGAAGSFFGGLDVTIGTYKPSAANAKKIALYAIKLELKDLRRALGKISRMAQNFGSTSSSSCDMGREEKDEKEVASGSEIEDTKTGHKRETEKGQGQGQGQQGMNPIDQLVIFKLYKQLGELLKTLEGLEDAA